MRGWTGELFELLLGITALCASDVFGGSNFVLMSERLSGAEESVSVGFKVEFGEVRVTSPGDLFSRSVLGGSLGCVTSKLSTMTGNDRCGSVDSFSSSC